MKRIYRFIITITACIAAMAASSCSKDETIRYNNATMGNIVDGRFISDQGNTFNIVEQTCPGILDTMKRAFVICDVLSETETAEGEYDVRINYIASVLTKNAIPVSGIEDDSPLANDPILLQSYWVSGGYINLYIAIPVVSDSKIKHYINFEYDDTAQSEGQYTFRIRHDSNGEDIGENNEGKIVVAYAYASVPVASIIKEDNAKIVLEWLNFKVAGNAVILSESEHFRREMLYSKDAYQQAPAEAAISHTPLNL